MEDCGAKWFDPTTGSDEDRANDLLRYVAGIEERQCDIHEANLWYAQLYSNRDLRAFDWGLGVPEAPWADPSMENLVAANGKILRALVGKNQVKATPVTRDGSWMVWRTARLLDRWLWGEANRLGAYDLSAKVFDDGYISGVGAARVDWNAKKKSLELSRIFFDDLIIDENECRAGEAPRHHTVRRVLPVKTVLARYKKELAGVDAETLVTAASRDLAPTLRYRGRDEKWVMLVETWRLPSDEGAGYHMIATHDHILFQEEWKHDWVPIAYFHYDPLPAGFRSRGGVEPAVPYQIRLNEVNQVIRESQDLVARARLLAPLGSQINSHDVDNRIAKVLFYSGAVPPIPLKWEAVSPELYGERERIKRECRRDLGIPEQAVNGAMPASTRLDSSAALREFSAIGEDYFTPLAQRFERWFLDLFRTMIRVRALFGDTDTKARYVDRKRGVQEIAWADVAKLKESDYTLELAASSVVNMSPAAREDRLNTWLAEGKITPEEYRKQMAHPDLESLVSIAEAENDDIERTLEDLCEGKFVRPVPLQGLMKGITRIHQEYLRVRRFEDVPQKVLTAMERWMRAALGITQSATQAPVTPPGVNAPSAASPQPAQMSPGPVF